MKALQNFVNGKFVDSKSGKTTELVNPATGKVFATAPNSNEADIDAALQAAAAAFPGWRDVTQVFHTRLHIHGIDQALGVVDQKAMREDDALGLPRRAGSVRKNRYVIGGSRIH